MFLAILTLFMGVAISSVAAFYSIAGLMAIFPGSQIPIMLMGGVLEMAKLVAASWVYRNWKTSPKLLKSYLIFAIIILMVITSLGIFGFLSKAHLEQTNPVENIQIKIERVNQNIQREEKIIQRAEDTLGQLDSALDRYFELGAVSKGLSAREEQKEERDKLTFIIGQSSMKVDGYLSEKFEYESQIKNIELEVGPIKYVAELIYNSAEQTFIDDAVRIVIMLIIFVFDPMAVLLIISGNMTLKSVQRKKTISNRVSTKKKDKKVEEEGTVIIGEEDKPKGYGDWKFKVGNTVLTFTGDYDMIRENVIKKAEVKGINEITLLKESGITIIGEDDI